MKQNPITHLLELYIKVNKNEKLEEKAREEFKKLEHGDKENLKLWKTFKNLSMNEFEKIYKQLGIKFDVVSGESHYNNKIESTIKILNEEGLLKESEGAKVIDLEKYGLGVALIRKSDGTTLYSTRDLTTAINRYKKYKFEKLLYEVGSEQSLHFKQVFKILELIGYKWADSCHHVSHGLYLGKDGKKFSTRKGKTIFMEDILKETKELAKKEIQKREKVSKIELEKRAKAITIAAIFYGDLKNYRENNVIFDINRFISFEGNTGPYLLYTYARAKSILRKAKSNNKSSNPMGLSQQEKELILELSNFPQVVKNAYKNLSPNVISNYSYQIAQKFNEFYHESKVIGSEEEQFRLRMVESFSHVLRNSLNLLGIKTIEKM